MKVFCGILTGLIGAALVTAICLFGQWLAWNGPQWMMMEDGDGDLTLGAGVVFPLILAALAVIGSVIAIIAKIDNS